MSQVRPAVIARSLGAIAAGMDWIAEVGQGDVSGISLDSRAVRPGDLYCALAGEVTHGAVFAQQAVDAGAAAIVTDPHGVELLPAEIARDVPLLVAADPRQRIGELSSRIYGHPSRALRVVGITGTDGKTTTAMLIEAALAEAGATTGLIGTVATRIGDWELPSVRTTPEAPVLHALLAVMVESGVQAVVMEVSSHALALGRVDGIDFDVAVFTNLGHDHLDFHHTQEEYFEAKARLFTPALAKVGLVCVDDVWGKRLLERSSIPTYGYSLPSTAHQSEPGDGASADWVAAGLRIEGVGWRFDVERSLPVQDAASASASASAAGSVDAGSVGAGSLMPGPKPASITQMFCPLPGEFNVRNSLAAIAAIELIGGNSEAGARGIAQCPGVPGRMQAIAPDSGFAVLVDYAHTPDAVQRALEVGRQLADHRGGRVICVLGCGGDRDRAKRPMMAAGAARLADLVIVTDDNPRSEDPAAIRADMMAGIETDGDQIRAEVVEIAGREAALQTAIARAQQADVVLALGKGHERTQEINGELFPLDDREVLALAIAERIGVASAGSDG